MNKRRETEKKWGERTDLCGGGWPICVKHCEWRDGKWGRDWGRERNLIYWKYYKLHLCITPQNYQPIKAECLLLSHYMEIRSHSESVSREGGRRGGEDRRKNQSLRDGWGERNCGRHSGKYTIMQGGKEEAWSHTQGDLKAEFTVTDRLISQRWKCGSPGCC